MPPRATPAKVGGVLHDLRLDGYGVSLVPLAHSHAAGLSSFIDDGIWQHNADPPPVTEPMMLTVIEHALADPTRMAFAVLIDGQPQGSTSFYEHSAVNGRIEIGHTYYSRQCWGGPTNPACKRLLLGHAFDTLGLTRVALRCAGRNARSAAAIAKLGATREGVLRSHRVRYDGARDDTVYFSILREEWPSARDGLDARLTHR